MSARLNSADLVPRVLAGETRAIARLMSRAEAAAPESRAALDEIFRHTGRAHILGITGIPGCGKSTLVARLAAAVRQTGRRIGIVAIDPSSPFSGGSILGDRIRMGEVTGDPGVFVRSMATHGTLGGLARGVFEAVDILDAAGFDIVIIETVGVGQDEVDIVRASHTTVVVSAPGLGDDIQAIKAGILEIADIHVVSKCDRSDSDRTISDLKNMLSLSPPAPATGLGPPPVLPTSAARGEGVDALLAAIDGRWAALRKTGQWEQRRQAINRRRLFQAGEEILRRRFIDAEDDRIGPLLERLERRILSPHAAARLLLRENPPAEAS